MKLKTLKEIYHKLLKQAKPDVAENIGIAEMWGESRELAIQWIKEMKRVRDNKIGGDNICVSEMVLSEDEKGRKTTLSLIPYEQDDFYGAITILKHFFGIKETDINEDD